MFEKDFSGLTQEGLKINVNFVFQISYNLNKGCENSFYSLWVNLTEHCNWDSDNNVTHIIFFNDKNKFFNETENRLAT